MRCRMCREWIDPNLAGLRQLSNQNYDTAQLELKKKPRLIAKIILIIVAGGEVVNEASQKVIHLDWPDSQVGTKFPIDASTNHHVQR